MFHVCGFSYSVEGKRSLSFRQRGGTLLTGSTVPQQLQVPLISQVTACVKFCFLCPSEFSSMFWFQKHASSWSGDSKSPLGVNEYVKNVWVWTGCIRASCPVFQRIGSKFTATQSRIRCLLKKNENFEMVDLFFWGVFYSAAHSKILSVELTLHSSSEAK